MFEDIKPMGESNAKPVGGARRSVRHRRHHKNRRQSRKAQRQHKNRRQSRRNRQ